MKRFLKWFAISVAALVVLLLGTVIGALYLVDPNEFKDELSELVAQKTGRQLSIEGDIEVSVFPWLGFEIGRTRLSNAAGFGEQPMLAIGHAEARVRLWSLFTGTPEIDTLVLLDLEARLSRNAKGQTNWADLLAVSEAHAEPAPRPTTPAPRGAPPIAFATVAGIRIEQASVLWQDQLNNQRVHLQDLHLRTGAIALQQAIPLQLSFNLDSSNPPLRGQVRLQADAWANPGDRLYRLDKLRLSQQLRGKLLPQGQLDVQLRGQQLRVDAGKQLVTLSGLELTTDQLSITGLLGLSNFSQPQIDFTLNSDIVNLDKLLPAKTGETSADEAADGAGRAGAALLPLALIKTLNLDGELNVNTLIMSNLTVSDVQLRAKAKDSVLQLIPEATLYDGQYRGNIRVDARAEVGKIAMQETLSTVQIGPLLQDYLQKDYLSGETNLHFRGTAKGNTLDSMIATLDGVATLKIKDAQLKSKHVLYDVAQAIAKRHDLSKPGNFDKQVTVFDLITGQFKIKDGIARNDDFLALSERVHIQGKGYLNLVSRQLDYTAYLIPKKSLVVPWIGGRRYDLKDQPIPYHVHGNLDSLKFDPDFEEVFKRLTKQHLESMKEEKEAELRRKVEEEKRQLEQKQAQEKRQLEEKVEQEKQKLEDKLRDELLEKLR